MQKREEKDAELEVNNLRNLNNSILRLHLTIILLYQEKYNFFVISVKINIKERID